MFCVKCGSKKVEVSEGVNGSDYIYCEKCGLEYNVFFDDNENTMTCDNTDCEGEGGAIKPVKMRKEFEGGTFNWCEDCRNRDKDMIVRGR